MGKVAVILQVMPEDRETDLEGIREEIRSRLDPKEIKDEPVAFGLVSLKVLKVVPDDAGGSDKLEEELLKIDGVKDVRVTDQNKL